MALIPLPDGSYVTVRPGETGRDAWNRAQHMYPEAFGIEQQHGMIGAVKEGARQGIASGARGIGSLVGSQGLQDFGTQMQQAQDTTPGAWRPTTQEDVNKAFEQGPWAGAKSKFAQQVSEPVGSMIGRYAIPTAVGAGAAALVPEGAMFGLGAAGTAALTRGFGFAASDFPMEQGENLQRKDERTAQLQAQGLSAPRYNQTETVAASLAQAALMPVLGHLGNKAVGYFKLLGPDLAAASKAVASGQMTHEAAVQALNSTAKNMLVRTGEAAAVGAPMMVGTEALRTAQSGEDIGSPEAMGRYGEGLKAAGALSPVLGAFGGARMRSAQLKALEPAKAEAAKLEAQKAAEAARQEAFDRVPQGSQMGLDIEGQPAYGETPNIPQGMEAARSKIAELEPLKKAYEAAGNKEEAQAAAAQIKEAKKIIAGLETRQRQSRAFVPDTETPAVEVPPHILTRKEIKTLGVPNNKTGTEFHALAGKDLNSPEVRDELAALVARYEENPIDAPDWVTEEVVTNIKNKVAEAIPSQRELGDFPTAEESRAQYQNQQESADALRAAYDRNSTKDMFTGEASSPYYTDAAEAAQPVDYSNQYKMFDTRGRVTPKASAPATEKRINKEVGQMSDMFNGRNSYAPESPKETPSAPSAGRPEDREALKAAYLDAVDKWQAGKISDAKLAEVTRRVRLNIGDQLELRENNEQPRPADEIDAPRGSDGLPVQPETAVRTGRPETNVERVGASPDVAIEPPRGPEPVNATLDEKIEALRTKKDARSKKALQVLLEEKAGDEAALKEGIARNKLWGVEPTAADIKNREIYSGRGRKDEQVGPTGIGLAGRAERVGEFLPSEFKLNDKQMDKLQRNLWWNDLAQLVADLKSSNEKVRRVADATLAAAKEKGTITKAQFEEAPKRNAEIIAEQARLRKQFALREAKRIQREADEFAQAAKMRDEGKARRTAERAAVKTLSPEMVREEQRRSIEEEADPEVARLERYMDLEKNKQDQIKKLQAERDAQIKDVLNKLDPAKTINVEVPGPDGKTQVVTVRAKEILKQADRKTKAAEALENCAKGKK